jgi:hypothetical protein
MKRTQWFALLCVAGAAAIILGMEVLGPIGARDFSDMWLAGRGVLAGMDPYNVPALNAFGFDLAGKFPHNWTYPPPMLFVAVPASWLPLTAAFYFWNALTAAFFFYASRPFLPRAVACIALASPAALINIDYGQVGFLVGGLWFLAFRYAPAAALLIVKPHMGFLAALPALTNWRKTALTGAIASSLIIASELIFGGWSAFFSHAAHVQALSLWRGSQIVWVLMATTPAVGYGIAGWLAFAAIATWMLSRNFNLWTAATATFLISPYGFHYDMTVACAGFALLLYERGRDMPPWQTAVIVLAFLSPAWVLLAGTWFVPPVLLIALAVQVKWQRRAEPHVSTGEFGSAAFQRIAATPAGGGDR